MAIPGGTARYRGSGYAECQQELVLPVSQALVSDGLANRRGAGCSPALNGRRCLVADRNLALVGVDDSEGRRFYSLTPPLSALNDSPPYNAASARTSLAILSRNHSGSSSSALAR